MKLSHPVPPIGGYLDVLSSDDGRTHRIDERVLNADPGFAAGPPVARCGRLVVVASLAAPPGPPCLLCSAIG